MPKSQNGLKNSHKLDLMVALFNRKPIRTILDNLSSFQLVEAHQFLWDKLVEMHFLTQKTNFVREEVTRQMVSSATYQKKQGCDLRLDYCKGVECIWSNPDCAGNKVKNNMEVMAKIVHQYFDSCKRTNKADKLKDYTSQKLLF